MRIPFCLCLALGLAAGEPALPGREPAFLSQVLSSQSDPSRPWKTFRVPEEGASAVVEVVGELTAEEQRQAAFQDFLVWFREDLRHFLKHELDSQGRNWDLASAGLPPIRFGGNPVPRNAPLGWGY